MSTVGNDKKRDENVIPALTHFCDSLRLMYSSEHFGQVSSGLKYLLVSPAEGSACKRLNLFLRWMVRNDDVDAGLWKSIDQAKLIVPIDVHMSRLCRILGFHSRKTVSLSTAIEVTESFTEIEPEDPVKSIISPSLISNEISFNTSLFMELLILETDRFLTDNIEFIGLLSCC